MTIRSSEDDTLVTTQLEVPRDCLARPIKVRGEQYAAGPWNYSFAAETAEHGARSGSDLLKTGRQQVRNIAGKVEERPFVSLAVAFATGLMMWGLLRR
jgi:hypothetical protein